MKITSSIKEMFSTDDSVGIANRVLVVFIIVLCCAGVLMLSGCTTLFKKPDPAVPEGPKTVEFDRSLLTDCKAVPKLTGNTDTVIQAWISEFGKAYVECATNKRKLNAEVKKAFNIKD